MCAERRRSAAWQGAPAAWQGAPAVRGFTLVETLVVLTICAGLVALVAVLYKSVATSAQALRGGQQEWLVQRQVREQLQRLFVAPKESASREAPVKSVSGAALELYLCSWQSREQGQHGMPAMVYLRYDQSAKTLYYHEMPLPAWWSAQSAAWNELRMQEAVRAARAIKLMTAVEDLRFLYLADGSADPQLETAWTAEWRADRAPRLIRLNFTKAGRSYSLWFATLAIEA